VYFSVFIFSIDILVKIKYVGVAIFQLIFQIGGDEGDLVEMFRLVDIRSESYQLRMDLEVLIPRFTSYELLRKNVSILHTSLCRGRK